MKGAAGKICAENVYKLLQIISIRYAEMLIKEIGKEKYRLRVEKKYLTYTGTKLRHPKTTRTPARPCQHRESA